MLSKLIELFSYCSFSGLTKKDNRSFLEWRQEHMHKQIAFISAVTGTLYIFLSLINRLTLPVESASYISNIQLFLIAPYIFLLSYLTYKKMHYLYIEFMLFLAPIYAATLHIFVLSEFETFNTYQVELYLMIFWIFTISGLRLVHAAMAALIVFFIGVLSAYILYPNELTNLTLHITWMLVSLIFGFSGGYLLEESQKNTFLKQKELEDLARKDKLTGLYNRQKLEENIIKELDESKRYHHAFGLIIFDIDYFKSINDDFGHQAGDDVLVEISKVALKHIRASDTLYRWGGEEFILVCLEVNKEEIELIGEALRKKIESINHPLIGTITVSLGLTISQNEDTARSIINRADKALYMAKNSGRNCWKHL